MTKTFTFPLGQATAILGALQRTQPIEDEKGRPKKVPAIHSYSVVSNAMALGSHPAIAAAEDARRKLIEKYGRKKENGDIEVTPEKFQAFSKEFEPIATREIKIDLEMFPPALREYFSITPNDMLVLMPLWEPASATLEVTKKPAGRGRNRKR